MGLGRLMSEGGGSSSCDGTPDQARRACQGGDGSGRAKPIGTAGCQCGLLRECRVCGAGRAGRRRALTNPRRATAGLQTPTSKIAKSENLPCEEHERLAPRSGFVQPFAQPATLRRAAICPAISFWVKCRGTTICRREARGQVLHCTYDGP